jgi:hypothetical protein
LNVIYPKRGALSELIERRQVVEFALLSRTFHIKSSSRYKTEFAPTASEYRIKTHFSSTKLETKASNVSNSFEALSF